MENKIPNGWKKVKFGDVVNKVNDKVPNREEWTFERYIGGEHFDEGEIRITRSALIEGNEEVIGSAFHMRFKPGQVLYVTRNPRLRKGGMVDFEGVCSNVSFVMEADETQLLQSLLPFIIQTEDFVRHTCNNAHGSTNPFLNWKDLAKYEFLLPPLEEQKKISEVLGGIERCIIDSQKLSSLMVISKRALTRKLLMEGLNHQEFIKYRFGKIPSDWKNAKVGDVCWVTSGKTNTQDAIHNGNYPLFDRSEIIKRSNKYLFDDEVIIIPGEGQDFSPKHFKGKFDLHQRAYAIGNNSKDEINMKYLYHWFSFFKKYFLVVAVGSTVKSLRLNHFTEFPLGLPSIDEQNKIYLKLDKMDEVLQGMFDYLKNLKNLRNKLSNELLKGSLRLK